MKLAVHVVPAHEEVKPVVVTNCSVTPTPAACLDSPVVVNTAPANSKLRAIDLYYALLDLRSQTIRWGTRTEMGYEIWGDGEEGLKGSIDVRTDIPLP